MDAVRLIEHKRDGEEHSPEEIQWLVGSVVDESIPDYQLAAWLMAVVFRGLSDGETSALTAAMAASGEVLDLSFLHGPVADGLVVSKRDRRRAEVGLYDVLELLA